MEPMPPKDPLGGDIGNVASAPAPGAAGRRPRWLVPTLATIVVVLLLVGFFPYLHGDGHRIVRVTCRLVAQQTGETVVGARVLSVTPGDLKVRWWSGEKAWGKWQRHCADLEALVQAGEEVDAWMWASHYDSAGARSSDDGSVELLVSLWLSTGESILWRSEDTQDPEDEVAALWIAPEGHEPVIVRLKDGHLQRHADGKDFPVWGTYDLGTVVVPVRE